MVKVGEPGDPSAYERFDIDGIRVFWNPDIRYPKPSLSISVRSFLLMKNVFAYDPETECLCSGGQQER